MPFFLFIAILFFVAAILTAIKLWQRTDIEDNTKLLWTIFIVITPFIGMFFYYLFGKQRNN